MGEITGNFATLLKFYHQSPLTTKSVDIPIVDLQHKVSDSGLPSNFKTDIWERKKTKKKGQAQVSKVSVRAARMRCIDKERTHWRAITVTQAKAAGLPIMDLLSPELTGVESDLSPLQRALG